MAMSVGDIFVSLGFKVDDKQLKSFDTGVRDLATNLLAATGAIAGTLYGIGKFISSSSEGAAKIANVAQNTGIATSELQKFSYAANAANSSLSFDGAIAGLAGLRKNLYDISVGKGNNAAWQILGIDPNGLNLDQIFSKLATATNGMDRARASDLLNQIGLGQDYLRLLENIYQNPDYVNQTGGPLVISDKDIATLTEADRILNNISKNIQMIKAEVTVGLFNGISTGNAAAAKTGSDAKAELDENGGYFGLLRKQFSNLTYGIKNLPDDPNANLSFSDSILGQTLKNGLRSGMNGLKDASVASGEPAGGDINMNVTINGADDPEQTWRVLSEHIQSAQDQRARSIR